MKPVRSVSLLACAGLALSLVVSCTTRAPTAVRFGREVDFERIAQLTRRGGRVVMLVDAAFWNDQQRVGRIPIARRGKTFIIGPGAAEMAKRMLDQVFDEVVETRLLERVDLQRFDYVVRLVHDSFDSRTLFIPLLTNRRFEVGIGAELSRAADGYPLARVSGLGSDSFWQFSLTPENRLESDAPIREKGSVAMNAAVQDALFDLMESLERALPRSPGSGP